ncbi:MAG: SLOG family protein, partial [Acidimicrobiales bacterium]
AGAPAGHLVAVVGHRPPDLGGYKANPVATQVRGRLAEILAAKHQLRADLVVLTGLGLGAEQLGAEAAATVGVPYFAVLPYPDPDSPWPAESRQRFKELLAGAAGQVVLQSRRPVDRVQAGAALRRRDAWLARHASEALVVWDGEDAMVGRAFRSLQDALGEEDVWVVTPTSVPGG